MPTALSRRFFAALAAAGLLGSLALTSITTGAGATGGLGGSLDPSLAGRHGVVSVIVQAVPSAVDAVAHEIRDLGGTVTRDLGIVEGFAARVPAAALHRLAAAPGVRAVSADARLRVMTAGGSSGPDALPSVYRSVVHADTMAAAGYAGQGVTVALIDTGVDQNLPDLAGRVVPVAVDPTGLVTAPCENLSGTADCTDNYGHGTFLAGLIAGNGAGSGGQYVGTAPKANVLSVKIAGPDGSADVSNVLAAIQWVVSFRNTYNIRVLNLSLGTDSTQSYQMDPLDYAVEQAWNAGIVVVVAASNRGPNRGTISKPGDDPYVITVGAVDDMGTKGLGDDELPNFSGRGPTVADGLAKPDVVAPGAHLVSLSAPNSTVATDFPSAMPAPYRRGSGTSMSTAVVSGVVADMLSANPTLTPDRVKFALMSTARQDASTDPMAVGAGLVDASAATFNAPPGLADQGLTPSTGMGSLQASRGTVSVSVTVNGVSTPVSGEETAQLQAWDPVAYTTIAWTPTSWWSSNWTSSNWTSSNWTSSNWTSSNWTSSNWTSSNWTSSNWTGASWYGTQDGSPNYGQGTTGSASYGAWDL